MTRAVALAVVAAALLAVPSVVDGFQITLLTQGICWGILALSVWLLLRICNLPSFGHAAFFGVGAYTAGLAVTRWEIDNVFVALALSIGLSCAVALPIALILGRLKSISFLLVTLAFADMLHGLAGRWDVLGGTDGLVGVIRPAASPLPFDLSQPGDFYYFALAILACALVVLVVVVRSPFGGVLKGIRESEDRMRALGYNPVRYRVGAFVLSAGIAGSAGLLNAYLNRFVDPADADALVSARALLIVVIAGTSVFGPPLVALALTELEDLLSSSTEMWLGIMGAVYILVALLAPERAGLPGLQARINAVKSSVRERRVRRRRLASLQERP